MLRRASFVLALVFAASAAISAASPPSPDTGAHPVILGEDTLFALGEESGDLSAQERARVVSARLLAIASLEDPAPESLEVVAEGEARLLRYAGRAVVRITPEDAAHEGLSTDSLAESWRRLAGEALIENSAKASLWRLFARIAGVVGILLLSLLVEWLLLRLARRARAGIATMAANGRLPRVRFQRVTLLTSERVQEMLLSVFNALVIAMHVVVAYAGLLLMFFVFPWTRSWGRAILSATLSPFLSALNGLVDFLPDLLHIVIIVGLAHFFLRLIRRITREVEVGNVVFPGFYADWARPTFNIFRFLFYAFVLVIVFPYLPGSDSPAFKGVTVFLGVMVSVGSSSAFSNVVAGLVITYMRSFRLGDRVQVGEVIGDVEEKTLLVTRIRTFHGETVTLPNAALLAGNTMNYTMAAGRSGLLLHTQVTIGYDAPWRKVHDLLLSAAARTDGLERDPEPFVLQKALNDFHVSYEVNAYTRRPENMNFIYSDLHRNIQDAFAAAGVEIMSPHFRAVRDGSAPAMPPRGGGSAA